MGHSITGLVIRDLRNGRATDDWDVTAVPLGGHLCLIHISHYYTAYWQARRGEAAELDVPQDFPITFPREGVVLSLAAALTGAADRREAPTFVVLMTDYFGGLGDQWACAFLRGRRVPDVRRINSALRVLGVSHTGDMDEYDTVGLGAHRRSPEYLDRYEGLCDDLGV